MAQGLELHYVEAGSDKFYRLLMDGRVVVVRWGRRGAAGQQKTRNFASPYDAEEFFWQQRTAKMHKGYREIFSASFLPKLGAGSADALNSCFENEWREQVKLGVWGDDSVESWAAWVVIQGLLGQVGKHFGAAVTLAELEGSGALVDESADLVVCAPLVSQGRGWCVGGERLGYCRAVMLGDGGWDEGTAWAILDMVKAQGFDELLFDPHLASEVLGVAETLAEAGRV